jgi:hypothetical protein
MMIEDDPTSDLKEATEGRPQDPAFLVQAPFLAARLHASFQCLHDHADDWGDDEIDQEWEILPRHMAALSREVFDLLSREAVNLRPHILSPAPTQEAQAARELWGALLELWPYEMPAGRTAWDLENLEARLGLLGPRRGCGKWRNAA